LLAAVFLHQYSLIGATLPDLPEVNTTKFLPIIRTQIESAASEAATHPRDAKATGTLAMTLHAYQQYDAALRAYLRAHLLEPKNFDWAYLLGVAQIEQGTFDEAAKSLKSALLIRPGDLVAELRLAETLTKLANWDDAAALYQRLVSSHPDRPQAWYGLGRARAARGDRDGASDAYAKACDLFPPYGAAHFALAAELRKRGRMEEAKEHLAKYSSNATAEPPLDDILMEHIHELDASALAHIQRGTELERAGKLQEAIGQHETALTIDPSNVQIHINLISLYGRVGDTAKAKQHLEASLQQGSGRADAWYNYGVLMAHERNDVEAERAFQRAVAINPYYAEARTSLGAIYQQRGQLDEASKEFRQAIADKPDYSLARFHLGRNLANQNKYAEAIEQFEKALQQPADERTPTYMYALGVTYGRAGDRQRAIQYLEQAREAAAERGQGQLLNSIERDLVTLRK